MTSGDEPTETKLSPREKLLAVQRQREATRVRATWPPVPDAEMLAAEAARKAEEAERHAAEEAAWEADQNDMKWASIYSEAEREDETRTLIAKLMGKGSAPAPEPVPGS